MICWTHSHAYKKEWKHNGSTIRSQQDSTLQFYMIIKILWVSVFKYVNKHKWMNEWILVSNSRQLTLKKQQLFSIHLFLCFCCCYPPCHAIYFYTHSYTHTQNYYISFHACCRPKNIFHVLFITLTTATLLLLLCLLAS